MTTIVAPVSSWQYQLAVNALPIPTVPIADWLNGVAPFGGGPPMAVKDPVRTEWPPNQALWMRRTVTLPDGEEFWIQILFENAVFVYWDGALISNENPTNTNISSLAHLFIRLTEAQATPGDHELILFCMDEESDLGVGDNTYVSVEVTQPAIFTQVPEEPIVEEWNWDTDLQTSFDGTETTAALLRYPKRMFSGQIAFDDERSLQRHFGMMFREAAELLYFPLFQYHVKLKAAVAAGASTISVNCLRSDFRDGEFAVLIEDGVYETAKVQSFTANAVTFADPLVNNYSKRAIVCPLSRVYSQPVLSASRANPDHYATASYQLTEYEPWAPFISELNEAELTMFDGLAVLEQIPYGAQFETALQSGLQVNNEFIGLPTLLSPWAQGKLTYPVRFLCNRIFDLDTWHWWIVFADHCQGSNGVFLLPTNRADLTVVTPAVGAGTTVTVESHDYSANYLGLDTFSRIVIDSSAGTHYASITGVSADGDNDELTFDPALPAGAGWDVDQKISFLLKVRNANDKITCEHYGLRTEIAMSLRTVA